MLKIIPLSFSLIVVPFFSFATAANDVQVASAHHDKTVHSSAIALSEAQAGYARSHSYKKGDCENFTDAHRFLIIELEKASDEFYEIVKKYEILAG
jgi:hypothetical protein